MIYRIPGRDPGPVADPTPPSGWPRIEEVVALVCAAIERDARRYLNEPITPFSTTRSLMRGAPPPRWRPLARRAWLARLRERLTRELRRHYLFCAVVCDAGRHG